MKKLVMLALVLFICGCVEAGKFTDKRNHLHELGQEEDYCQKNPERCVNGVAW